MGISSMNNSNIVQNSPSCQLDSSVFRPYAPIGEFTPYLPSGGQQIVDLVAKCFNSQLGLLVSSKSGGGASEGNGTTPPTAQTDDGTSLDYRCISARIATDRSSIPCLVRVKYADVVIKRKPLIDSALRRQRETAFVKRSGVTVFTRAARRRMAEKVRNSPELNTQGKACLIVLTDAGDCPVMIDAKSTDVMLRRFLMRLRRAYPFIFGVWGKEFQKRGAMHLNFFVDRLVDEQWVRKAWHECTKISQKAHAHFGAYCEPVRETDGASRYISKYLGKEEQKRLPEGWGTCGRWWGVIGERALDKSYEIEKFGTAKELAPLIRVARNWINAERRERDNGTRVWGGLVENAAGLYGGGAVVSIGTGLDDITRAREVSYESFLEFATKRASWSIQGRVRDNGKTSRRFYDASRAIKYYLDRVGCFPQGINSHPP
jgi:hypothetical protein